jgi:serine/threonine-protein kinase
MKNAPPNGTACIQGALSGKDPRAENEVLPDPFPGEFRVTRLLGEGAFGKVWLADDLNLGRQVALKALRCSGSDEAGQRALLALRRDAHLLVQVQHPNVVQVYAWRSDGDEHYMVMQYVPGGSLADRLKGNGPLPWPRAARYIADVGEGLLEVHTCGIIHRDIKPANVLWDPKNDRALLTDFGVSGHLACARTVAGTPLYMAPEAFEGRVRSASDVYSLSVTLFNLLTCDLPFPGDTVDEVLGLINAGLPTADSRLRGLPAELECVLRSGLARLPEQRIPLQDLVQHLRKLPAKGSAVAAPIHWGGDVPSHAVIGTVPSQADGTPPIRSPLQGKRRIVRLRHVMMAVVAASLAVAVAAIFRPAGGAGFQLSVPKAVTVAAGEQISIAIQLHRAGFLGAVEPLFEKLPVGLKVEAATILPGQAEGLARIIADLDAPAGTTEINLRAVAPSAERSVPIMLTVHEAQPPWVPEQCQPALGAKRVRFGRITFWDRVICRRQGLQLPLVLIPKKRAYDPSPFYIMENKVSRAVFEQFARARPEGVARSQWRANWARRGADADGELPVLHVTCDDAWQFAAWMRGRLPTVAQWDKAAGRYDGGGSGPFVEPWNPEDVQQIAVGRAADGPLRVGTATGDVSRPFGLHDMAGNGLEWTSTPKQSDAPLPPPRQGPMVAMVLRGRSFADPEPLRFKDLDLSDPLRAAALPYYSSNSAVGFRIVLDQLPFE